MGCRDRSVQDAREVVHVGARVRVFGAKHAAADLEHLLLKVPALANVPLGLERCGEVVDARERVRVLGPQAVHAPADLRGITRTMRIRAGAMGFCPMAPWCRPWDADRIDGPRGVVGAASVPIG
jgi:hypothetical protein